MNIVDKIDLIVDYSMFIGKYFVKCLSDGNRYFYIKDYNKKDATFNVNEIAISEDIFHFKQITDMYCIHILNAKEITEDEYCEKLDRIREKINQIQPRTNKIKKILND